MTQLPQDDFETCLETAEAWMKSIHERLKVNDNTQGPRSALESRLRETEKICSLEPDGKLLVDMVLMKAKTLLSESSEDEKHEILVKQGKIKTLFEETTTYMTHCHSRIEWVWLHWNEYLRARDEFTLWVHNITLTLEPDVELQLGLKEKCWQYEQALVLLRDVSNQSRLLDRLLEEAASLYNRIGDPSVDESVQSAMMAEYKQIKKKTQERVTRLEKICKDHEAYDTDVGHFKSWLNSVIEKLKYCVGAASDSTENRLNMLREIGKDVEIGEKQLEALEVKSAEVIRNTSPLGTEKIYKELEELRRTLAELKLMNGEEEESLLKTYNSENAFLLLARQLQANIAEFRKAIQRLEESLECGERVKSEDELLALWKTLNVTKSALAAEEAKAERVKVQLKDLFKFSKDVQPLSDEVIAAMRDYQRVKSKAFKLSTETESELRQLFQNPLREFLYWKVIAESVLDSTAAPVNDGAMNQDSMDNIERLLGESNDIKDKLAALEQKKERIHSVLGNDKTKALLSDISAAEKERAVLHRDLLQRKDTLQSLAAQSEEFDSVFKVLRKQMSAIRVKAAKENELQPDIIGKQAQLQQLQMLLEDLTKLTSPIKALSSMVESNSTQAHRANQLSSDLLMLQRSLENNMRKSKENINNHWLFNNTLQDLQHWVMVTRGRLEASQDGSRQCGERDIEVLLAESSEKDLQLHQVEAQGQQVIETSSPEGAAIIHTQIQQLIESWDSLQQLFQQLSRTLKEREQQRRSPKPGKRQTAVTVTQTSGLFPDTDPHTTSHHGATSNKMDSGSVSYDGHVTRIGIQDESGHMGVPGNQELVQGVSGHMGVPGSQGPIQGASGHNGMPGNQGLIQGASGQNIVPGIQGFIRGASGQNGMPGSQGHIQGTSGHIGVPGNQGLIEGASGHIGVKGNQGHIQGASGHIGVPGNPGLIQGASGHIGVPGNQGLIEGASGHMGVPGNQGLIQGASGHIDVPGNQGHIQGASGHTGVPGNQGLIQGASGHMGVPGNQGLQSKDLSRTGQNAVTDTPGNSPGYRRQAEGFANSDSTDHEPRRHSDTGKPASSTRPAFQQSGSAVRIMSSGQSEKSKHQSPASERTDVTSRVTGTSDTVFITASGDFEFGKSRIIGSTDVGTNSPTDRGQPDNREISIDRGKLSSTDRDTYRLTDIEQSEAGSSNTDSGYVQSGGFISTETDGNSSTDRGQTDNRKIDNNRAQGFGDTGKPGSSGRETYRLTDTGRSETGSINTAAGYEQSGGYIRFTSTDNETRSPGRWTMPDKSPAAGMGIDLTSSTETDGNSSTDRGQTDNRKIANNRAQGFGQAGKAGSADRDTYRLTDTWTSDYTDPGYQQSGGFIRFTVTDHGTRSPGRWTTPNRSPAAGMGIDVTSSVQSFDVENNVNEGEGKSPNSPGASRRHRKLVSLAESVDIGDSSSAQTTRGNKTGDDHMKLLMEFEQWLQAENTKLNRICATEMSSSDRIQTRQSKLQKLQCRVPQGQKLFKSLLLCRPAMTVTEDLRLEDLRYRWMLYKSKLHDSENYTNLDVLQEPRVINKKSGGLCSFLHRVCCAALPLQLLLLLLLLLLLMFLLPLVLESKNCALSNNFARSFNLMLKYEGPPPT